MLYYLEAGVTGVLLLGSEQRYTEAKEAYHVMEIVLEGKGAERPVQEGLELRGPTIK